MKRTSDPEDCDRVRAALLRVGGCSKVPFIVENVDVEVRFGAPEVTITLILRYLRATPVCCPEPGCYIPFLGRQSDRVPSAIQDALSLLETPRVTARVHLTHEDGYEHLHIPGAKDALLTYQAEQFSAKRPLRKDA